MDVLSVVSVFSLGRLDSLPLRGLVDALDPCRMTLVSSPLFLRVSIFRPSSASGAFGNETAHLTFFPDLRETIRTTA